MLLHCVDEGRQGRCVATEGHLPEDGEWDHPGCEMVRLDLCRGVVMKGDLHRGSPDTLNAGLPKEEVALPLHPYNADMVP